MGLEFVSLFCGCGGFDLGFVQAGFKCRAAFDIDPVAVEVHRANIEGPAHVADLSRRDLQLDDLRGVDVVVAGPPCQGFSTVGKRLLEDPRNHLLLRAAEIALALQPRVVVIENVMGVVSGTHRKYWDSVKSTLREAGYNVVDFCCDASRLGLAQTRRRRVLLAWRGTAKPTLDYPRVKTQRSLQAALQGLEDAAADHEVNRLAPRSRQARIARQIKAGQKLCNVRAGPTAVHTWDIPQVFGETTRDERELLATLMRLRRRNRMRDFGDADPVTVRLLAKESGHPVRSILASLQEKEYVRHINGGYDLTNTFNGTFKRLRWDRPAPTVHTRFGNPRFFLHPEEQRGFTVREAARIQGFPDSFVFTGTRTEKYRLVGNAVPPPLGLHLAEIIREDLLK